jgi:hypothetical protein
MYKEHVRCEVFTAVTMKNVVFWDVASCRSCVNRSSLADFSTLKMEAIRSSETSIHARSTRRHIPEDDILYKEYVLCVQFLSNTSISSHGRRMGEWRCSSTILISALDGGEWLASRHARFAPGERAPVTPWIGGWVAPRIMRDFMEKRKTSLPYRVSKPDFTVVQPVAVLTDIHLKCMSTICCGRTIFRHVSFAPYFNAESIVCFHGLSEWENKGPCIRDCYIFSSIFTNMIGYQLEDGVLFSTGSEILPHHVHTGSGPLSLSLSLSGSTALWILGAFQFLNPIHSR